MVQTLSLSNIVSVEQTSSVVVRFRQTHNFGVTINVSLTVSCESGYWKFERWKVKLQNNSREFPRNGTLAGYCSLNKQTVWASVSDRNVRKVGQWVRTTTIKQQKQQQQKQQQRQQQQQN